MGNKTPTEERIVRTAERLFAQRGFESTGMRAIAKAAQVSIGAIYHHFKSKEDILERIIRDELDRRRQVVAELKAAGLPVKDQIQKMVEMHFSLLKDKRNSARLFFRERFDPSFSLRTRIQELYDEVAIFIAEVIGEGIAAGEIRPCQPLVTAYAILGMMEAVSLRIFAGDDTAALLMEKGPQELAESLWRWLRADKEVNYA
ncbi:MAG TPA: TetR/AcrR family transcriptional regulator [Candidatus Acetothermia bacterium]|nr:TetR/AcrR family transcriptional regulator [Candidatus Acetothermia bacterium]